MTRYIFMVLTGAASFGILSSFVKLAYQLGYSPAEISFAQALTGAAILWTITLFYKKKPASVSLTRKMNWPLLLTGAAIGLTTFTYYLSVAYIPASLAIVILMQFTWLGLLLEWILFKRKPSWPEVSITAVILAGTIMAGGLLKNAGTFSLKGILYALTSSFLYAVYIVANSKAGKGEPLLKKSAIIMTGSAITIFLVNVKTFLTASQFEANLIKWALFLAVFGTVIPPVLFARGIPRIGAGLSAILMTVELPVAIISAYLILGESIDLWQWLGVSVMLGAIVVMNLFKGKTPTGR